jgi:hypothetical protein
MGEIQEFLRRSSRKPAQREDDEGDLERSVVELTQSLRKGEVDTHSSNSSVSSIDEDSQGNEGRSRVTEDVDAFEDAIRREFVLQSPTPLTDHVSLHRGIVEGVDDLELEEELEEDDAQSTVEVTEARRGSGLGSNNSNLDPDSLRERERNSSRSNLPAVRSFKDDQQDRERLRVQASVERMAVIEELLHLFRDPNRRQPVRLVLRKALHNPKDWMKSAIDLAYAADVKMRSAENRLLGAQGEAESWAIFKADNGLVVDPAHDAMLEYHRRLSDSLQSLAGAKPSLKIWPAHVLLHLCHHRAEKAQLV